jgi:hypothetical protein
VSTQEQRAREQEVDMTEDCEERIAALETKVEGLSRVMAQAAEIMKDVRDRQGDEKGRSEATLIVTLALVQALGRAAPEILNGIIQHIDRVTADLPDAESEGSTSRELALFRTALDTARRDVR